jgi:hypothetical protein
VQYLRSTYAVPEADGTATDGGSSD